MRPLLSPPAAFLCLAVAAGEPAPLKNGEPLSPERERATFAVPEGFRVELVAAEPGVIDPVAMTFDERGRIFVAEMRGYPNGGRGTGVVRSGRIRMLEDRDGDGYYETSTVWADGLRFPTGLMPWRGGLIVCNAPDLLYLRDARGTGKADETTVLYTGFDVANIQQLVNSPQLGLDNWVHACAGGAGGSIRSAQKKDAPPVELRGRGVRFRPDVPGSLEPTSGGGQYGLTADDWGRWFVATNSQHLRHVVLPDAALRRNPGLAVRAVTLDIPEHGAACKVFRKSPFEAWRVERTTRRAGGPDAPRFPTTELVPGGYVTSGCSPLVYTAGLFPKEYRGSVFVCDPANNLILRDTLTPRGATFVAHRGHVGREFLTSTDNWFRPVHLTLGPDGAVYVLDFYREVIETPLSLPPDILARVNTRSRARGRIWRVTTAPAATRPERPALDRATTGQLVARLADGNSWYRLTAQRLLLERRPKDARADLEALAVSPASAVGRAHALWTLDGLGLLNTDLIGKALADADPGVREQALRLAEGRLAGAKTLLGPVAKLAGDADPKVRFQAALTLGASPTPEAARALARIARRKDADTWTQTAVLSSAGKSAGPLLEAVAAEPGSAPPALLTRLAALVGVSADDAQLAKAFALLGAAGEEPTPFQMALLDGLGQGLAAGPRPLPALWDTPPPALTESVGKARLLFDRAARVALDDERPPSARADAVRLLGRGPFAPLADVAPALLSPRRPPEVQLAAVRALSAQSDPRVGGLLVNAWGASAPAMRRELTEALFARKERVGDLIAAIENKKILAGQVEPRRLAQLLRHPDASFRSRAVKFLAGRAAPTRAKVVDDYKGALESKGDARRGKKVFAKNCATCHKLEGVGVQVGADLIAGLKNKSADRLLADILDPSREVDPRYVAYQVTTRRGRVFTGLIAAETAASITLKRGEGAEDTILRTRIEAVESTGRSLMPDGLEAQITKPEMADLIAYLREAGR